jgi:hypothetical protein
MLWITNQLFRKYVVDDSMGSQAVGIQQQLFSLLRPNPGRLAQILTPCS